MSATERPLAGRSILLTRGPERSAGLCGRLRRLGAAVAARPAVALVPPRDAGPAREAIDGLEAYDWTVFTSANGVRFFSGLLRAMRGAEGRPAARIAAIGPATADALARRGWPPELVAGESRSEGLAAELAARIRAGERVLLVRPEVARTVLAESLRAHGARVDAVAFYRNLAAPGAAALVGDVRDGRYDVVAFYSPSGLERLLEAAGAEHARLLAALSRARIVAIGPVTAAALARRGLPADAVAARPSDAAVVEAVLSLPAGRPPVGPGERVVP